jgi:hypothetical protein
MSGSGDRDLGTTTILVAIVAFTAGALSAAAYLARVVQQQLASSADTFPWKFFMFVTVQVLIFVIYLLSVYDNKDSDADAQQHKDPCAPAPHHPAPPPLTEETVLSAMKRKEELAKADRTKEYRVPRPVYARTDEK